MAQFDTEEIVIGGTEWKTAPFRFNRMFTLSGGSGGSYIDVLLSGVSPLVLTNALELNYLKLFGGTEQRNVPSEYTQVEYVTNSAQTLVDTGVKIDFSKNYEIELRVRGVTGSWYVFQAKEVSGSEVWGISGSTSGETIRLAFGSTASVTSQITRVDGNIYYIKATINNGNLTLYVKDETAGTEDTATGTYTVTTGQSPNMCLFGNLTGQYVAIYSNVYFARIKENGNYIMDYVPCKQSTTAGFYDKVSGTFKTTTDLVADGNTVPSPDTPVDIVCNNGALKVNSQGQIYTDGTVETVKITGKNLFDGQWQVGIYNTSSGAYTSTTNRVCNINMIQVEPSTNYTVSCPTYALENGMRWVFYDANKNFVSAITNGATTITTPSNAKYINFYIANNLMVDTAPDLQLEQGSTATTYEAYFNGGTATAEMLLKVGTYQDVHFVIDGAVTRNVGIKVFDGTENWSTGSAANPNRYTLAAAFNDLADLTDNNIGYSNCYTVISRSTSIQSSLQNNECGWNTTKVFCVRDDRIATLEQWKQFLADQYNAGTPVIVVYPLATPTTESATAQPLTVQTGTNIVTITQASIDDLTMELSYKQST